MRRDTFLQVPADRLLVETDAPAMSLPPDLERHHLPPSETGQPVNHPANLLATYAKLATLRGMTLPALAQQVAQNFHRLFG